MTTTPTPTLNSHPYRVGKMIYATATEAIAKAKAAAVAHNVDVPIMLRATGETIAVAVPVEAAS